MSIGECNLTPTQLLGHKPLHERPGTETLLRKQAKEKKQGTNTRQQAVSTLRCTYSPGGNRCTEKVLPLTKHCIKRILFILDWPKWEIFQGRGEKGEQVIVWSLNWTKIVTSYKTVTSFTKGPGILTEQAPLQGPQKNISNYNYTVLIVIIMTTFSW